jgi:ABC-type transport system involved in multi-copper enzyme maturation permease subunit
MTIRDLGYRPYDGARLPPSNNTWVMLRQSLRRAWGSWLVKLATFLSFGPPLIIAAIVVAGRLFVREMQGDADADPIEAGRTLRTLFSIQLWLFVSMITVGAGASAIAEDLTYRAFQFYFAKPVTRPQYLAGRMLAVGIWVFAVTFLPALFVDIALVGTAPRETAIEQLALLLPCLAFSLVTALVMASGSVAISSLSTSRALTMSAWVVVFFVPYVLAAIVDAIVTAAAHDEEGWPWLYLGSLTGLLGRIGDLIFNVEAESPLEWWHAAIVLVVFVAGAQYLAWWRLKRAEVIT